MDKCYQNLAVVIPSLDPTEGLVTYIKALVDQGFMHIFVVNDGSSNAYEPIFKTIGAIEGCTLLMHGQNRGKGAALKTAFRHICNTFGACAGIITADSDGQHAVKDVCQMANALPHYPGHLLLGGRDFSRGGVPFKSLLGNRISSGMFRLLHGLRVADTQTGLRGFDTTLLAKMLEVQGERFEYEMAVLVACANDEIPTHAIAIDTIYIDGNSASHFRPLTDSWRIGHMMLDKPCRFLISAFLSCMVDIILCWSLLSLLSMFVGSDLLRIGLSVVLSRMVSMAVNYTLNKSYVFRVRHHAFGRYFCLVVANMLALTALIYVGRTYLGLGERTACVLVNAFLCLVNYQVQRRWVFPSAE